MTRTQHSSDIIICVIMGVPAITTMATHEHADLVLHPNVRLPLLVLAEEECRMEGTLSGREACMPARLHYCFSLSFLYCLIRASLHAACCL